MKSTPAQLAATRRYHAKNKDKAHARYLDHKAICNAQSAAWRINNRERYNELIRSWRHRNPESRQREVERVRLWEKNNPEKFKEMRRRHAKAHRSRHRERLITKSKAYRQRPEVKARENERGKRWRKANPEKRAIIARNWRLANMDKVRIYAATATHKRRAIKRGNTVNPKSIRIFVSGVRNSKTVSCYYCGTKVSGTDAHLDHIIPLAKGGAHSVENLCVACADCNCRKHTSLIQDWITVGQQLLNL